MLIMNKQKYFILALVMAFVVGCKSKVAFAEEYKSENVVISYGAATQNSQNSTPSFSFNSENKNLVCLGFLDEFNDSLKVFFNQKEKATFLRSDSISYKSLTHQEVYKVMERSKSDVDEITILMKKNRSKVSFQLVKDKRLYLISHFGNTWFVSIWD